MAKRDGFILHEKTMAQVAMLTDEQAGELLKAMIAHYNGEQVAGMSQLVSVLMVDISERMDVDKANFEEISKKRKEAGRQGAMNRWHSDDTDIAHDSKAIAKDGKRIAKHGESDSDSDSESVSPTEIKRKVFKPPTVDEVKAYCLERHNTVDANSFVDFYSAKGWKVGNQAMKDWKACVRTWERREKPSARSSVNRFQNFPARNDTEHKDMVAKIIAMQTGG